MKDKSKLKGKHVQALVTDEMEQQIFDICFKQDISVSELIRRALKFYIDSCNCQR